MSRTGRRLHLGRALSIWRSGPDVWIVCNARTLDCGWGGSLPRALLCYVRVVLARARRWQEQEGPTRIVCGRQQRDDGHG
jgi:hypothetical protein